MMIHTHTHAHVRLLAQTHISPSCLQERFPCTHAALHATCVLISPACEESSQQRQSYCRLYCETSGRGAPVVQFLFAASCSQLRTRRWLTMGISILSYCLPCHFDQRGCPYCRRRPTVLKLLSIIITFSGSTIIISYSGEKH